MPGDDETAGGGARGDRPPEPASRCRAGWRRAIPALPPPAALERERASVDGVGAQARQAPRAEPPAARGDGHELRGHAAPSRPPASATSSPSTPTRGCPEARSIGWSARWRIRSIGRGSIPGRRRVVEGYAVLQPRVTPPLPGREGSFFQRLSSGPAGIDPYAAAVSDVYQDLFGRRLVHRQGHLRRGRVRGGAGGTGAGERAAEPRPLRGRVRARRSRHRRRAVRERPLALRGRGGAPAPMGAWRLAAASVDSRDAGSR